MTLVTLARQVARDVCRDLGWIVLFDPSPQDVACFRGAVLDATGLYARMAAFALIYQALPTCLTLAAMAGLVSVRAELVPAMALTALAVVVEALLVALLAWRRLRAEARQGLRVTRGA